MAAISSSTQTSNLPVRQMDPETEARFAQLQANPPGSDFESTPEFQAFRERVESSQPQLPPQKN